jgi:hypothetical protein
MQRSLMVTPPIFNNNIESFPGYIVTMVSEEQPIHGANL